MKARDALVGARIRRIDGPWDDLLALTLAGEHVREVLLLATGRARGVGLVKERPRGQPASAFVQGLRRRIEGARIEDIEDRDAVIRLRLQRGGDGHALELWLAGAQPCAVLFDDAERPVQRQATQTTRPEPGEDRGRFDVELEALRERGHALLERQQGSELTGMRLAYARAARSRQRSLQRRLDAVRGDLARADEVQRLRHQAGLLLSHLHALAADARQARVIDSSVEPPVELTLELEAGLGPRQQAEAWYRRARRLERGAGIARQRLALTESELAAVETLLSRIDAASDEQALQALSADFERAGVALPREPARPGASTQPRRSPYREFQAAGGRSVLVGRGPADNDRLTLDHARPQDLWLHARGYPGAHVVVPLERGEACPPDLLADAAMLAAHFSKAKDHERVDVSYTPRRYVRKPRKAAPGLVTLQREKVLRLDVEPGRLRKLLDDERRPR